MMGEGLKGRTSRALMSSSQSLGEMVGKWSSCSHQEICSKSGAAPRPGVGGPLAALLADPPPGTPARSCATPAFAQVSASARLLWEQVTAILHLPRAEGEEVTIVLHATMKQCSREHSHCCSE